jgi:hypothetical protein
VVSRVWCSIVELWCDLHKRESSIEKKYVWRLLSGRKQARGMLAGDSSLCGHQYRVNLAFVASEPSTRSCRDYV